MQENNFTEDGVQKAMKLLQEKQNNSPSQPISPQGPQDPDSEARIQKAMKMIQEMQPSQPETINSKQNNPDEEYTYGERGLQGIRGVAKTYGETADAIRDVYPMMSEVDKTVRNIQNKYNPGSASEQEREKVNLSKELPELIDKIAGRDLTPKDTIGKVVQGTGQFFAPMPIPGAGAAMFEAKTAKGAASAITKELLPAAGASAAIHATPKLFDEQSPAGFAEDLVKTIIGAKAGMKAAGTSEVIAKRLDNLVKREGVIGAAIGAAKEGVSALKEIPGKAAAKVASLGSAPKQAILDLAKKYDIDLPFNVGTDGRWQNFSANNIFNKSIFTSKVYETVVKNADEKMIKVVDEAIDSLGSSNLKPTEASIAYKDFLKEEAKTVYETKEKLYDEAKKFLTKEDVIVPSNADKAITNILEELKKSDTKSSSTQEVYKKLEDLGKKWGIIPETPSNSGLKDSMYDMTKLMEKLKSNKTPIDIERLIASRSELMKDYKHDPQVSGSKALLKGVAKAIDKDILSSTNKNFVTARKEADAFYKLEVKDRVQSDIAKAIMKGDAPELAYSYMTNIPNIDLIEKIAGKSAKGVEVFNSLKKAKVREILSKAFETDGSLKTGNFASSFKKEAGQELIERLVGKTEYTKLKDIAEIASEYSRSGKQLLNTSGTALTSSELGKVEAILGGVSGLFGIAGNPGTLLPGIGYAGTVNIGSRLLADPKFVNQMHAYAMAAKAGKQKDAATLAKRLSRMIDVETATKATKYTITENINDEENPK
jgi:hypothetical protein